MKRWMTALCALAFLAAPLAAEKGFDGRPPLNNVSMPTGFTLNQGEFQVGLGPVGFGFTERFQVSTNILLFLFQDMNADLRFQVLRSRSLNASAGFRFHYWDLEDDGTQTGFLLYTLYLALSPRLNEKLTLHLSGQWSSFSSDLDFDEVESELREHIQGTSLAAGLEYSLSQRTKVLAEGGYDITFQGPRFAAAVLFGWETFRLKLGVSRFHPEGRRSFTMPVVSLWWRFKG